MSNFAILRTQKLKTVQDVAGSGAHVFRLRDTPNADPARKNQNRVLVGGESNQLHRIVGDRIEQGGTNARIRKDSVRAIEFMLTASPEWFQKASKQEVEKWQKANVEWLQEKYGKANLVSAVTHFDEMTPHIHAHVVPITKDGRLSAKDFIGGDRNKHRALQTEYARKMEPFGLERGTEKSIAKHDDIKSYYKSVNEAKDEKIKIPFVDKPPIFNREEYQKRMRKRVSGVVKNAKNWKHEYNRISKTENSKAVKEAEEKLKKEQEHRLKMQDELAKIMEKKLAIDAEYSRYREVKNKHIQELEAKNESLLERNKLLNKQNKKFNQVKSFNVKPD